MESSYFDIVQTLRWTGVTADFGKHRGMRRVQCISIVATSFLISQVVGLFIQNNEQLQYAVVLVGVSYGAVYGLIPIIAIEWFGIGPSSVPLPPRLQKLTYPPDSLRFRTVAQPMSQRTVALLTYLCW